jgi:hypothetical protein
LVSGSSVTVKCPHISAVVYVIHIVEGSNPRPVTTVRHSSGPPLPEEAVLEAGDPDDTGSGELDSRELDSRELEASQVMEHEEI